MKEWFGLQDWNDLCPSHTSQFPTLSWVDLCKILQRHFWTFNKERICRQRVARTLEWEFVLPISWLPLAPEPIMYRISYNFAIKFRTEYIIIEAQKRSSSGSEMGAFTNYSKGYGGLWAMFDLYCVWFFDMVCQDDFFWPLMFSQKKVCMFRMSEPDMCVSCPNLTGRNTWIAFQKICSARWMNRNAFATQSIASNFNLFYGHLSNATFYWHT